MPRLRGKYSPIDPVVLGTTSPCPGRPDGKKVVSLVVGTNAELMASVAQLWIVDDDVVVDATYAKGGFWTHLPGLPHHCFDLLTGHDLRSLPLEDQSVDVLALDPPYRPRHGSKGKASALTEAYGLTSEIDTINDVLALYEGGLAEAFRVLRTGGRVLVKCQDISYGNRLHLVTLDILRSMIKVGFDMADEFILGSHSQLGSSQWENQERARRSHSRLWVGVKP